jgi:4-amino-4-deoxy-L-arabinose transferase-like glycosyltransferase
MTYGLLAAGLFAFSSVAGGWYTVVKTHGLATLLLFASYMAVATDGRTRWRILLGGVLLGLAVGVRLTFAGVAVAFGLQFLLAGERGHRWRTLGQFSAGMAVGLLPSLALFLVTPGSFVFDNLTYHSLRSGAGLVGDLWQKGEVLLQLFGARDALMGASRLQFSLLLVTNVYLAASAALFRRRLPLALYIAAALFLIHLLPTPTFVQYFSTMVPFLVVGAMMLVARLGEESADSVVLRRRLSLALGLGVVLYLSIWPYDYGRSVGWTGKLLPRLHNSYVVDVTNWTIPTIRRVSRAIDQVVASDSGPVLTWWPGYLVEAKASAYPGTENNWGRDIAGNLTPEQRARYRIFTEQEMEGVIRRREAPVVVLGNWAWEPWHVPNKSRFRDIITQNAYRLVEKIGDAEVYRRTWFPTADELNSRFGYLIREFGSGLQNRARTVLWPTVCLTERARSQAGLLADRVLSYQGLYEQLRANRRQFDDFLPVLAFWAVGTQEEHPEAMGYMDDCESYISGGYRFTLLRVDPDSVTAVFLIDTVEDGQ